MVRLLLRRPRAGGPPSAEEARVPRVVAVAAVAAAMSIALAGCGAITREARDADTTAAPRSSGGAAVAPAPPAVGEAYATESGTGQSASKGAVAGGAPDAAPDMPLPEAGEGRDIIRTGAASLRVRSVPDAFESVRQIATAAGGTVADSSFTGSGDGQSASLTVRVPVDRFGDVVAKLREVAVEVESITTGSTDVTEQVMDIEATLRNLRAVEAQYVQLLARTGSINEVLAVQDRLNQVRLQIERTEARRQSLAARAEMSTITVSLRPVGAAVRGEGLGHAVREAWAGSLALLTTVVTTVAVAVVYLWWTVPLIVVAVFLVRRNLRGPSGPVPPPATGA